MIIVSNTGLQQVLLMRKVVRRQTDQLHQLHLKPVKRKEFLVDPSRVQLDQYMLKQIKKNKRSVKSLSKEVVALRREVGRLQEQHDDYMLLQKTRAQQYSQSHLAFAKNKSTNRIALTQAGQFRCGHKGKHREKSKNSKESSVLSISSSAKSSKQSSSQSKIKKSSEIQASKLRLSRKIEELKAKALLEEKEKEKIEREVQQKILKVLQNKIPIVQTPTQDRNITEAPYEQDYDKLLQLLKTSQCIKQTSEKSKKDSPIITQFAANLHRRVQSLKIEEEEQKIVSSTIAHSSGYIPLKSSKVVGFYEEKRQQAEDNLKSQTNLLDSPEKARDLSPPKQKKELKMSRCIEIRIQNEHPQSQGTEGSCFDGVFGGRLEVRSATVEMSFQDGDSSKKRLKQLQFQFDQLVRQQLMCMDPRQKQMLSQTIRSVLWSITELKGKISNGP